MSFLTYTQGIPNTPNNPSNDQPIMKVNNDSNFAIWPIDHYGFNDNNGGKHKYIRIPTNAAPASTGLQEILLLNAAGGTGPGGFQLHYLGPNKLVPGNLVQLTRNEKPVNSGQGFSWLPGGLLIQWGIVNNPGFTGNVVFPTPFTAPTPPYSIVMTMITATVTATPIVVIKQTVPPTNVSFTYTCNDNTASNSFYWMAIGT